MNVRTNRFTVWFPLLIIPALLFLAGCPKEEENPYLRKCTWMAGDFSECEGIAIEQGCDYGSIAFDPATLACAAAGCLNCDITGVSCTSKCTEAGYGNYGWRETSRTACIDEVIERSADTGGMRGGWMGAESCCCIFQ